MILNHYYIDIVLIYKILAYYSSVLYRQMKNVKTRTEI